MKLTQRTKQFSMMAVMLIFTITLSACHKRGPDLRAIQQANEAYNPHEYEQQAALSSGIGEDGQFADGTHRKQLLSKRVYYFDFDSNIVHSEDRPAIVANAEYLINHPNSKILLEGHTDPRGSREYNIGLGERRAKAVADILTTKGVNRSQIRIVSYGAQKLANSGHTESDYQLDRRGVVVYLQNKG